MGPSGLSWDVAYEFAKAFCAVVGAIGIVAGGAISLIGWYLTRSSEDLNRFSAEPLRRTTTEMLTPFSMLSMLGLPRLGSRDSARYLAPANPRRLRGKARTSFRTNTASQYPGFCAGKQEAARRLRQMGARAA